MSCLNKNDDFEQEIVQDPQPLIKEGVYEVVYVRHVTNKYFSHPKLYVYFKIVSPGEHYGTVLFRAYNIYDCKKGHNSDFRRECEIIIGRRLKKREKASTKIFKNNVLLAKVTTVKSNFRQEQQKQHMHYSKIASIVDIAVGAKQ